MAEPWGSGRGGKGYCTQLRAPPFFQAHGGRKLSVIFPLLACLEEMNTQPQSLAVPNKGAFEPRGKKGESPCPPQPLPLPRHLVLLPLLLFAK